MRYRIPNSPNGAGTHSRPYPAGRIQVLLTGSHCSR
jgi:hypothetical protein